MKSNLLHTIASLSLVTLSAADSPTNCLLASNSLGEYNACCSGQVEGISEIDGIQFEYFCDSWWDPQAPAPVNTASARECAQLCYWDGACTGSTWVSRNGHCYLTTSSEDLQKKSYPPYSEGYMALRQRIGLSPPESACAPWINAAVANETTECANRLKPIQDARDVLERENQAYNTSLRHIQKERDGLNEANRNLSTALSQLQRQTEVLNQTSQELNGTNLFYKKLLDGEIGMTSNWREWARCPGADGKEITVQGVTYRQFCNQRLYSPNGFPRDNVILGYEDCIASCNDLPWCRGINFWTKWTRACFRFDYEGTYPLPKNFSEQVIAITPV
ncbi:uncharacterized protein BP01DRAFT_367738 [Aspergillus saccharolyticus JOP 1030-1]|uniref:Apple domain-containing protein n=1 Tax=Aspergillus saccharolyticus JOP 1030-1 TaxID=1450539 RepID=A0A318Z9C0_9EURO|nr:hypothetical protein BP01DRAFT_367738 [Aspergillus saccharolyticus JOP 1030-1]PYH43007.1 hypothetical protein BP01DRAFT_367738 [Aspergillus saccharolyticus JOP 1030-1]